MDTFLIYWSITYMLKVATCSKERAVKFWHTNCSLIDLRGDCEGTTPFDPSAEREECYGVSHVLEPEEVNNKK